MVEGAAPTPTAAPKESGAGRPLGAKASRKDIQTTIYEIEAFMNAAQDFTAQKFGVASLNDQQKENVTQLCKKIISSSSKENWVTNVQKCVANLDEIEKLQPMQSVLDTADQFQLDEYSAAILHHSAVK